MRCELRAYYRLSSVELDLIRSYKLETDKENKTASIGKSVTAKVHLQVQNPERYYESENTYKKASDFEDKKDVLYEEIQRYDYILSIDLGEKILASCSLSKIDWNNFDWQNPKQGLIAEARFFLPLNQNFEYKITKNSNWEKTNLGNKKQEKKGAFEKFLEILSETEYLEINSKSDRNFQNYLNKVDSYHRIQKTRGVVSDELKNSRKNLTNQLAEQIATQIAILAKEKNALVVFENLSTGFGRQVETVKIYTELKRLVAKKLGKLGVVDLRAGKTEADLDNVSLRNGAIGRVSASFTSKTCSNCGYIPTWFRPETKKDPAKPGIEVLGEDWEEQGILKYSFDNHTFYELNLPSKEIESWKITKILENGNRLGMKKEFENQFYFYKKNTSINQKPWLEIMQNYLFTKDKNQRTNSESKLKLFHKFALKTFLNPRNNQEKFECPNCGHSENADYQASWNIGVKFLRDL